MFRLDLITGKSITSNAKSNKVFDIIENLPHDEALQGVSEKVAEEIKSVNSENLNPLNKDIFNKE